MDRGLAICLLIGLNILLTLLILFGVRFGG